MFKGKEIAKVMGKMGGRRKLSLEERKLVSAMPAASKYFDILSKMSCTHAEKRV